MKKILDSILLDSQAVASSFLLAVLLIAPASAGTIVEVRTSLGDFYIEVDEEAAPITGGNFLSYVRSGRYNNTFIHSATGGSIIRGGGYTYGSCTNGPQAIPVDDPIPLEMTGLSNLDGTIAALRPSTEPDGATSQWFINIGNDPGLDSLNGGYAVFGRVIGDGMSVVRQIAAGNPVRLGFFIETPTVNYFESSVDCQQFSRDNLIQVLMSVIDGDARAASANYDAAEQTLTVNIDLQDQGFQQLLFSVDASAARPQIIARLDSLQALSQPRPNMATYDPISGLLSVPRIAIGDEIVYRNVLFELLDAESATFVLLSAD